MGVVIPPEGWTLVQWGDDGQPLPETLPPVDTRIEMIRAVADDFTMRLIGTTRAPADQPEKVALHYAEHTYLTHGTGEAERVPDWLRVAARDRTDTIAWRKIE